jgi:hypothetical protein
MRRADVLLVLLFAAALGAGTITQRGRLSAPPRVANGWLLSGDFHVHAFPGDGLLTPAQLRDEAARRNLHVIALTNHNHMLQTLLTTRSQAEAMPIVLQGEEITTATAHVIALGISDVVRWQDGIHAAIDTVHARGGIAILAHPAADAAIRFDATLFDGVEVANAGAARASSSRGAALYRAWDARREIAAVGSSDFHHAAPLGEQRTILLVGTLNEQGVLGAIRDGRTAVRVASGWVGDSTVMRAAMQHRDALFDDQARFSSLAAAAACALAWLALLALVLRS